VKIPVMLKSSSKSTGIAVVIFTPLIKFTTAKIICSPIDEVRHAIVGQMPGVDDRLDPIHMVSQIGRRRDDRVREIGCADENGKYNCQQDEYSLPGGKIK